MSDTPSSNPQNSRESQSTDSDLFFTPNSEQFHVQVDSQVSFFISAKDLEYQQDLLSSAQLKKVTPRNRPPSRLRRSGSTINLPSQVKTERVTPELLEARVELPIDVRNSDKPSTSAVRETGQTPVTQVKDYLRWLANTNPRLSQDRNPRRSLFQDSNTNTRSDDTSENFSDDLHLSDTQSEQGSRTTRTSESSVPDDYWNSDYRNRNLSDDTLQSLNFFNIPFIQPRVEADNNRNEMAENNNNQPQIVSAMPSDSTGIKEFSGPTLDYKPDDFLRKLENKLNFSIGPSPERPADAIANNAENRAGADHLRYWIYHYRRLGLLGSLLAGQAKFWFDRLTDEQKRETWTDFKTRFIAQFNTRTLMHRAKMEASKLQMKTNESAQEFYERVYQLTSVGWSDEGNAVMDNQCRELFVKGLRPTSLAIYAANKVAENRLINLQELATLVDTRAVTNLMFEKEDATLDYISNQISDVNLTDQQRNQKLNQNNRFCTYCRGTNHTIRYCHAKHGKDAVDRLKALDIAKYKKQMQKQAEFKKQFMKNPKEQYNEREYKNATQDRRLFKFKKHRQFNEQNESKQPQTSDKKYKPVIPNKTQNASAIEVEGEICLDELMDLEDGEILELEALDPQMEEEINLLDEDPEVNDIINQIVAEQDLNF